MVKHDPHIFGEIHPIMLEQFSHSGLINDIS